MPFVTHIFILNLQYKIEGHVFVDENKRTGFKRTYYEDKELLRLLAKEQIGAKNG